MSMLVTGSAGHLGEAVVRSARAAGRSVVGIDRKSSAFTDHVGSICDRHFIAACMQGATTVVHAATLHKPHVATHSWQDFIDTNVTGTLVLLEAAAAAGVETFVYVSTTSVFGAALARGASADATWVTEDLIPRPRNIYGLTKLMAENLCELAHRKHRLPIVALRTSRFFPEEDDDPSIRRQYETANAQASELLYRRVDIEDAVSAVLLATEKAPDIGFGTYIIAATTPFKPTDLPLLGRDAPAVVRRIFPESEALFAANGWKLFPTIDRVYVNERARAALGWRPRHDFAHVLECLRSNRDFRSLLAREIGSKGYHDRTFAEGPYPVE
ncbi:MAG TPA: NAD(P)-dependent oxidoreductase [Steroidobacteraceae bacterium]|nr:NAD(P)-dependent oxidoreductase [Steroidobacteraceae bacterium]